jgi:uncharacterized protein YndB with AHSA1/START domain
MSTHHGYFLIADITGYTQYLSASELEHAQQTLTALLNLLVRNTKAPLILSRLAGDAVISYGLAENFVQSQTFVEIIETTYVSFRRAIELMTRNTTCPCNACRNIPSLDLKFFVHFGEFAVQKLDAHDELIGSDVNLIHRLLKNHVTETTGFKAYCLFTDAAIHRLGLRSDLDHLVPLGESYEHLGSVRVWAEDMHPVWERRKKEAQITLTPDRQLFKVETDIAVSPQIVWDYLVQPDHFNVLAGGTRMEIANRRGSRVDVGSVFECYHGDGVVHQIIVEWHPFEQLVAQYAIPIPLKGAVGFMELRLTPTDKGTRFAQIFGKSTGPLAARLMGDVMFKAMFRPKAQADLERFRDHIVADYTAHATDASQMSKVG